MRGVIYFFSMMKEHFQDIVPSGGRHIPVRLRADKMQRAEREDAPVLDSEYEQEAPRERSIRNINITSRRRPTEMREMPPRPKSPHRRRPVWLLWSVAAVALVFLAGILLVALRATTVSVTPRVHAVAFDTTSRFVAYPAASATEGTLAYTTRPIELEDSEVVQGTGTVRAEDKASGTITVFNEYSTDPVTLVKNTRFESQGLIFRAPADIVVPGKKGTVPGKVSVTVIADVAGEKYNIAATRFTLPGLKSSDMYTKVYATSAAAMAGGFVGDRPGVSQSALDAAIAELRTRLEQKVRAAAEESSEGATAFSELASITFEHMPNTSEAGGGVRIHERARAQIPIFVDSEFAEAVARSAAADADGSPIRLVAGTDLSARPVATSTILGTDPLQFTLSGSAQLIWIINETELQQALAGKDKAAFNAIVAEFPGVQSAKARIEPFWSGSFPSDPTDIRIKIVDPAN